MNLELKDYFIQQLTEIYEAPYWLAYHLFTRWNIEQLVSKNEVDQFLDSKIVKEVVFAEGKLNNMKRYTQKELDDMGIALKLVDPEKHEFLDTKFGYRWQQIYHGMSDVWVDRYQIVSPAADDSKLIETMAARKRKDSP